MCRGVETRSEETEDSLPLLQRGWNETEGGECWFGFFCLVFSSTSSATVSLPLSYFVVSAIIKRATTTQRENFIDAKWIAQHRIVYRMNVRNCWLNVPHLPDPSTSLASTACRFLALYTIARFYLLRHLSIEVNVVYIKWLKYMEELIVPEILNQPIQQLHLF